VYKISSYVLPDSYVSWLRCHITSVYSFVWIHSIYLTPSEVLSGVSSRICPWASLIYLLLSLAILFSTQNIFCLLTLSNCYISPASDSALPQTDIDSICSQCAADFMKLNTDETKVRSTMLTMYCLNQTKRWDSCTSTYFSSITDCSLLLYYTIVSPK
jgi:hypothetical protein